jgi:hypothetical protein
MLASSAYLNASGHGDGVWIGTVAVELRRRQVALERVAGGVDYDAVLRSRGDCTG